MPFDDRWPGMSEEALRHAADRALLDQLPNIEAARADEKRRREGAHAEPAVVIGGAEVRTISATGGQKGSKLARFDLIPPEVLWELAEHYGKGAEKYDDDNWRKGYDWKYSFAAAQRHMNSFWMGEDYDPETGSKHVVAAMWHMVALAWFMDHFPQYDNRPAKAPQ